MLFVLICISLKEALVSKYVIQETETDEVWTPCFKAFTYVPIDMNRQCNLCIEASGQYFENLL